MGRILYLLAILVVGGAFLAVVGAAVVGRNASDQGAAFKPEAVNVSPGRYRVTERPDLRPAFPSNMEYTPEVRDITQHRVKVGLLPRSIEVFDGGRGDRPRPTVVLFHGAGRPAASMIDMWDEVARRHGLLLVSLQAPRSGWQTDPPDAGFVLAALNVAKANHPIDEARIFLFGHSNGARMAQIVANRVDGPWKAVAVHAGFVDWSLIKPVSDAPPIRHYLGSSDGIFAVGHARTSGQHMAKAGHDFELVIVPEHTHWFYIGGPQFAEDAWRWFAQHGRSADLANPLPTD